MLFRSVRPALLAAATAGALLLAGCSSDPSASAPSSVEDVVVETSSATTAPAITVPRDFSVDKTSHRVIRKGQGDVVTEGQVIGMQYVMINGRTGEQVAASAWDQTPTSLVVDGSILPGLKTGLLGRTVGSEVLIAVAPAEDLASAPAPATDKVDPSDSLLFFVSIISAVPPRAEGSPVEPEDGLPTVTLNESTGEPTITIPDGIERPSTLVVQQLIKGSGPPVEPGQTIRVQYTGITWSDPGEPFDTSWKRGGDGPGSPVPFVIGAGQVIKGWDAALIGQPVGSQVLIIVPPDQGYGEEGNVEAGIAPDDTLVFVVDILAAS